MSLRRKLRKGMYIALAVSCLGTGIKGCHYVSTHEKEIKKSIVENEEPCLHYGHKYVIEPGKIKYSDPASLDYYHIYFKKSEKETGSLEWLEYMDNIGLFGPKILAKREIPMSEFGEVEKVIYHKYTDPKYGWQSRYKDIELTGERKEEFAEKHKSKLSEIAEHKTERDSHLLRHITGQSDISDYIVGPK